MPPQRPSSPSYPRLAALASLALLGCSTTVAPSYPTTDRWPEARRQPDGVALDPLPAPSQPARSGLPSGQALALLQPASSASAVAALQAMLEALAAEDAEALPALFTERSTWVHLPSRSSTPLFPHLRERLRRLDYLQLADMQLIHEPEVEVYTVDDLAAELPGRPLRPPEMQPTDLLLRARILVPRLGADRFFGDALTLVVRPEQGRYRIHSVQEEFMLP